MILFTIKNIIFQSTPSAWRETKKGGTVIGWIDISIHSLRMEGDVSVTTS